MKVFVFEYAAGGAMAGESLPGGILAQGAAMWRAVVADFAAPGGEVRTTRDARVDEPAGVHTTVIQQRAAFDDVFDAHARWADATLVIAPEFDNALVSLLDRLDALGVRSLGCSPNAVGLCSDKLALAQHLAQHHVPTPATALWHEGELIHQPTILKPRRGAGCEKTYVVYDEGQAAAVPKADETIMQSLVRGRPVSASYLVRPDRVTPLLAGRQFVHGDRQFSYHGGRIPLGGAAALSQRALTLGMQAVETVDGLRGYVGVDMVLGDDAASDMIIEINPRLTMSYLGLRELCTGNLAEAMLDQTIEPRFRSGQVRFDETGQVVWEQDA